MLPIQDLPKALGELKGAYEFAGVAALTRTAVKCRDAARESMVEEFTLRNKWSRNSVAITPATMEKQQAEVYVRDQYLAEQETGATRSADPMGIPIPIEIRAAAGIAFTAVIPKSLRGRTLRTAQKAIKGNKPFVARTKGGKLGVWVREKAEQYPIMLLYVLHEGARKIAQHPWFQKPVNDTFDKELEPEFNIALEQSLERWRARQVSKATGGVF